MIPFLANFQLTPADLPGAQIAAATVSATAAGAPEIYVTLPPAVAGIIHEVVGTQAGVVHFGDQGGG
jgi:hypothetical protein